MNEKARRKKRAQTNVLVISLIVLGIVVAVVVFYNIIKVATQSSNFEGEELATVKPSSCYNEKDCDDKNDCTEDVCERGKCKYNEEEDGTVCSIKNKKEEKGLCKEGKCVSG